jgi:pilus assembly protein TadC
VTAALPLAAAAASAALALTLWWRVTGGPVPAAVERRLAGLRPGPAAGVPGARRVFGAAGAVADRVGAVAVAAGALVLGRSLAQSRRARRRAGAAVVAGAVGALVVPWGAPGAVLATWLVPAWAERRARARRDAAVVRALPEAVDLTALAVAAGANVPVALAAVARRGPEPIAGELGRALGRVGRGGRLPDALGELPARLGEEVRPLVAALIATERDGAPLRDSLARLADDVRRLRRRRAEEAARRVPVKLLFPLVVCTLPAFALLTVAPFLAGALGALAR